MVGLTLDCIHDVLVLTACTISIRRTCRNRRFFPNHGIILHIIAYESDNLMHLFVECKGVSCVLSDYIHVCLCVYIGYSQQFIIGSSMSSDWTLLWDWWIACQRVMSPLVCTLIWFRIFIGFYHSIRFYFIRKPMFKLITSNIHVFRHSGI